MTRLSFPVFYYFCIMKHIILTFLAFVFALVAAAQDNMRPLTTFVPDSKVHDFGVIKEKDGKVSHQFVLRNTGKSPVVISDVTAWCGCTTVGYTKRPVRPGESAKVTVTYNPLSRPGKFSKEVVVITGEGTTYTRLWVKGNVMAYQHPVREDYPYEYGEGLFMNLKVLSFPPLQKGEQYVFNLMIANDTDHVMNLKFVRQPDNRVLKMPATLQLKPRERTKIKVAYRAPQTYGRQRWIVLQPYVNGKAVKSMKVTFAASRL